MYAEVADFLDLHNIILERDRECGTEIVRIYRDGCPLITLAATDLKACVEDIFDDSFHEESFRECGA